MVTTQKSKYDVWASNLLFLAFALSLLMGFLRHTSYFADELSTKDYIILYLIQPLVLVLYYYIRQGSRPAKTLFLALAGVTILQSLANGFNISFSSDPLWAFDLLSQFLLSLGAGVLVILSLWFSNNSADSPRDAVNTRTE